MTSQNCRFVFVFPSGYKIFKLFLHVIIVENMLLLKIWEFGQALQNMFVILFLISFPLITGLSYFSIAQL